MLSGYLKKESHQDLQLFILRGSMFKKLYESNETISIIFEGKNLDVEIGQTVASALLVSGIWFSDLQLSVENQGHPIA